MRTLTLLAACCLGAAPVLAQSITGLAPARNTTVAPLNAPVTVTLSAPAGAGSATALKVFSTQAGGKLAGTTQVSGNTITFQPARPFKPGETIMATLPAGAGGPQAWEFTTAASGSGHFSLSDQISVTTTSSANCRPHLADLDNDGDLDLVSYRPDLLAVYLNDGQGRFTPGWSIAMPPGGGPGSNFIVNTVDIDNDGDLDMVGVSDITYVIVLFNNGNATFTTAPGVPFLSLNVGWGLATGDIDADGDIDFVATSRSTSRVFDAKVTIGLNNGSGTFIPQLAPYFSSLETVDALRDVNGDGALDALTHDESGILYVRFNNGTGNFNSPGRPLSAMGEYAGSVMTDFDGDNDLDLIISPTSCYTCPRTAKLMENDGAGNFNFLRFQPLPGINWSYKLTAAADVDGDGRPDLILPGIYRLFLSPGVSIDADSIQIMRNLGNGTFDRATSFHNPLSFWQNGIGNDLSLGDINGDGDLDLVAASYVTYVNNQSVTYLNIFENALLTGVARPAAVARQYAYPNPVGAGSALHISLPTPATRTRLSLSTVVGQVVRSQNFTGGAVDVATTGLAPGLYLLQVQPEGQAPVTQRIVVE